jgi:hypothetical protein
VGHTINKFLSAKPNCAFKDHRFESHQVLRFKDFYTYLDCNVVVGHLTCILIVHLSKINVENRPIKFMPSKTHFYTYVLETSQVSLGFALVAWSSGIVSACHRGDTNYGS